MASVTLEQMEEYGLNQVCLDLCKGILNTQTSDGSELSKLLPVKYIINNWNAYNEIAWVNPITEKEYKELLKKIPEDINWLSLEEYELEDTTTGSQELSCTGDVCEVVDIGQ